MLGYRREDVTGKRMQTLFPKENHKDIPVFRKVCLRSVSLTLSVSLSRLVLLSLWLVLTELFGA
jgi:hypothetical protein